MSTIEFKPWPKIQRVGKERVVVTEKIDGTNACIVIQDGEIVGVQSRKRFITPEDDNFGFAAWVEENKEDLKQLGDGYHYGEWAGEGIQKNPLNLEGRRFFLFDTLRWNPDNPSLPSCCNVVPILYEGDYGPELVDDLMYDLWVQGEEMECEPEGIVILYLSTKHREKATFKNSEGKWKGE